MESEKNFELEDFKKIETLTFYELYYNQELLDNCFDQMEKTEINEEKEALRKILCIADRTISRHLYECDIVYDCKDEFMEKYKGLLEDKEYDRFRDCFFFFLGYEERLRMRRIYGSKHW